MITKDHISEKINENLPKYQNIQKYLGKSITSVLEAEKPITNLLENRLLRSLYFDSQNLISLEEYLKELSGKVNIESAVAGIKNNFLEKYSSFFYELDACYFLVNRGEKEVRFIPTKSGEKTPDLEYVNGEKQKCYVEVKGFNSVSPEMLIIDDKLKARAILDGFFNKTFLFEAKINYIALKNSTSIEKELKMSFSKLLDEMEKTYNPKQNEEQTFTNGKISYKYKIFENNSGGCRTMFHGGGDWKDHTQRPIFMLTSIYSRVFSKFHEAYEQLLLYRKNDYNLVKNDSIFMYVNSNGSFDTDSIKKINAVIKTAGLIDFVNIVIK